MDDIIPEAEQKIVEDTCAKLLEQFDSCRIFVTRHDGNGSETAAFTTGGGNFYAQIGQCSEWMTTQNQHVKNKAIRDDESDSE